MADTNTVSGSILSSDDMSDVLRQVQQLQAAGRVGIPINKLLKAKMDARLANMNKMKESSIAQQNANTAERSADAAAKAKLQELALQAEKLRQEADMFAETMGFKNKELEERAREAEAALQQQWAIVEYQATKSAENLDKSIAAQQALADKNNIATAQMQANSLAAASANTDKSIAAAASAAERANDAAALRGYGTLGLSLLGKDALQGFKGMGKIADTVKGWLGGPNQYEPTAADAAEDANWNAAQNIGNPEAPMTEADQKLLASLPNEYDPSQPDYVGTKLQQDIAEQEAGGEPQEGAINYDADTATDTTDDNLTGVYDTSEGDISSPLSASEVQSDLMYGDNLASTAQDLATIDDSAFAMPVMDYSNFEIPDYDFDYDSMLGGMGSPEEYFFDFDPSMYDFDWSFDFDTSGWDTGLSGFGSPEEYFSFM